MAKVFRQEAIIPHSDSLVRNNVLEANLFLLLEQHTQFLSDKKKFVVSAIQKLRSSKSWEGDLLSFFKSRVDTDSGRSTSVFINVLYKALYRDTVHLAQKGDKNLVTDLLQGEDLQRSLRAQAELEKILNPVTVIEELEAEREALEKLQPRKGRPTGFIQDLVKVLPLSEAKKIITWYQTFPAHQTALPPRIFYPLSVLSAYQEARLGTPELYDDLLGRKVPAAARSISQNGRSLTPIDFRPYVRQQSSEAQSVSEDVSNSRDAYLQDVLNHLIGRYGLGGLTNLRHINGRDSHFELTSKTTADEIKAIFVYNGDEYFVCPEVTDRFSAQAREILHQFGEIATRLDEKSTGTVVEVRSKFTKAQQQAFFDELPKKFQLMPHVRVLATYQGRVFDINQTVTQLEDAFSGERLTRNLDQTIFVTISPQGYQILDFAAGFDRKVLLERFFIPGRGTKPFQHEGVGPVDLYSPVETAEKTSNTRTSTKFQIGGLTVLEIPHSVDKCGFIDQVISLPSSVTVDESRSHLMIDEHFQSALSTLVVRIDSEITDPQKKLKHFNSLTDTLRQIRKQRGEKSQEARIYTHFALNIIQPLAAKATAELRSQGFSVLPNLSNFLHMRQDLLTATVFVDDIFLLGQKEYPFNKMGSISSMQMVIPVYGVPLQPRVKNGKTRYRPVHWESSSAVFMDADALANLESSPYYREALALLINQVDTSYMSPIKIHRSGITAGRRFLLNGEGNDRMVGSSPEEDKPILTGWEQVLSYETALKTFFISSRKGVRSPIDPDFEFFQHRQLTHLATFADHIQHLFEHRREYSKNSLHFMMCAFSEAEHFTIDLKIPWLKRAMEQFYLEKKDWDVRETLGKVVFDMNDPWTEQFLDKIMSLYYAGKEEDTRKDLLFMDLLKNPSFTYNSPLAMKFVDLAFEYIESMNGNSISGARRNEQAIRLTYEGFLGNPTLNFTNEAWKTRIDAAFDFGLKVNDEDEGISLGTFDDFFSTVGTRLEDQTFREKVDMILARLVIISQKKPYVHNPDALDTASFRENYNIHIALYHFVEALPATEDSELQDWVMNKLEQVNKVIRCRNMTLDHYPYTAMFYNRDISWDSLRMRQILTEGLEIVWQGRTINTSWAIANLLSNPQLNLQTEWARQVASGVLNRIADPRYLFIRSQLYKAVLKNPSLDLEDPWIRETALFAIEQSVYLHSRTEKSKGLMGNRANEYAASALREFAGNEGTSGLTKIFRAELEGEDKIQFTKATDFIEALGFTHEVVQQVLLVGGVYMPELFAFPDFDGLNANAFKAQLDRFQAVMKQSAPEDTNTFWQHRYLWNLLKVAREPAGAEILQLAQSDTFAQALIYFDLAQPQVLSAMEESFPSMNADQMAQLNYCAVFASLLKEVKKPDVIARHLKPLFHRSEKMTAQFGEIKELLNSLVEDLTEIDRDNRSWSKVSPTTRRFVDALKQDQLPLPIGERQQISTDHQHVGITIADEIGRFREGHDPLDQSIVVENRERFEQVVTQTIHSQTIRWDIFVRELAQNMRDEAKFTNNNQVEIDVFEEETEEGNCLVVKFVDHGRGMDDRDKAEKLDQPGVRDAVKVQSGLAEGEIGQGSFSVYAAAEELDIHSTKDGQLIRERRKVIRNNQSFVTNVEIIAKDEQDASQLEHGTTQYIRIHNPADLPPQMTAMLIDNAVNLYMLPLTRDLEITYRGEAIQPLEIREVSEIHWNGSSVRVHMTPHNKDGYERVTRKDMFLTTVEDPKLDVLKYVDVQFRTDFKNLGYDLQVDIGGLDVTRTRGGLAAPEREIELRRKMVALSLWAHHAKMYPKGECKDTPLPDDCLYTPGQAYDTHIVKLVRVFNDALQGKNVEALASVDFTKLTFSGSRTNYFLQQILMLIEFEVPEKSERVSLDYIRQAVLERRKSSENRHEIDELTNLPKDVPSPFLDERPEIISETEIMANPAFKKLYEQVIHLTQDVYGIDVRVKLVNNKSSFADGRGVYISVHQGFSLDTIAHESAHVLEDLILKLQVSARTFQRIFDFIEFLNPGKELNPLIKKIKEQTHIREQDIYKLRQLVKMPERRGEFYSTHSQSIDTPFGFLYRMLVEMATVRWTPEVVRSAN